MVWTEQSAYKGMYGSTRELGYLQYNQLTRVFKVQLGYYMACTLQLEYYGMYSTTKLLRFVQYK